MTRSNEPMLPCRSLECGWRSRSEKISSWPPRHDSVAGLHSFFSLSVSLPLSCVRSCVHPNVSLLTHQRTYPCIHRSYSLLLHGLLVSFTYAWKPPFLPCCCRATFLVLRGCTLVSKHRGSVVSIPYTMIYESPRCTDESNNTQTVPRLDFSRHSLSNVRRCFLEVLAPMMLV